MKRLAQAAYRYAMTSADASTHLGHACDWLEEALLAYKSAGERFLLNDSTTVQRAANLHWVLVQQLSLQAVLRQTISADRWSTAWLAASLYLEHPSPEERAWAHARLAELLLISLARADADAKDVAGQICDHPEQLIALVPE
jgi:hypothetical protein